MNPESWDRAPCWAPALPSPCLCSPSRSLSQINKSKKERKGIQTVLAQVPPHLGDWPQQGCSSDVSSTCYVPRVHRIPSDLGSELLSVQATPVSNHSGGRIQALQAQSRGPSRQSAEYRTVTVSQRNTRSTCGSHHGHSAHKDGSRTPPTTHSPRAGQAWHPPNATPAPGSQCNDVLSHETPTLDAPRPCGLPHREPLGPSEPPPAWSGVAVGIPGPPRELWQTGSPHQGCHPAKAGGLQQGETECAPEHVFRLTGIL